MNGKVILLIVGLLIGGLAGWLTRPEAAQLNIGPLKIEVQGQAPAQETGSLSSAQTEHVAIFAVIGALAGLVIGFAVDRRKSA